MSSLLSSACQRDPWIAYTETLLLESALETGCFEAEKYDLANFNKVDVSLRPLLLFTPAIQRLHSLQVKAQESDKTQKSQRSYLSSFASSALAYIFDTPLKAIHGSAKKTNEFMHRAVSLQSWHTQLLKVGHPIAKVSTDLIKLTNQVHIIDEIRTRQAHLRLRFATLALLGGITWTIGFLTPARWMITASQIMFLSCGLFYTISRLWYLHDATNLRKTYKEIGTLANQIVHFLCYYNPEMKLQPSRQEECTPSCFVSQEPPTPLLNSEQLESLHYEDFSQQPD